MPLPQLRLCAIAKKKHNAYHASASAMHGCARFVRESDALNFASEMQNVWQWYVHVYQQGENIAVDWTCQRRPNGQHTYQTVPLKVVNSVNENMSSIANGSNQ